MTRVATFLLGACGLPALIGCTNTPTKLTHTPEFAPVQPIVAAPSHAATGSIYNGRQRDDWFGRGVTYQVGDIITVLLNEATQAARTQSNTLSRTSSNDVMTANLVGALTPGRGAFSDLKMDGAEITNEGSGEAGQQASLTGSVTATVVEILANGNLLIRGEKQLALSEGTEVIQLSGIVRPNDISPANTVQSQRLANAQIAYRGTGDLANASRAGWGTSLLMKVWPF